MFKHKRTARIIAIPVIVSLFLSISIKPAIAAWAITNNPGVNEAWILDFSLNNYSNPLEGITIKNDEVVYIADPVNDRIIEQYINEGAGNGELNFYGSAGTGNGQFQDPYDIAIDSNGNFYVADSGNNRIQKFDSDFTYIDQWGEFGASNGQFYSPQAIYIDDSDNIYVVDSYNDRIQVFNTSGTHIRNIGSTGNGDGQFSNPTDVAVDSDGNFYVADNGNGRVQVFNSSGTYVRQWSSPTVYAIDVNDSLDTTFVYTSVNDLSGSIEQRAIFKFSSMGVFLNLTPTYNTSEDTETGTNTQAAARSIVTSSNGRKVYTMDFDPNYSVWGLANYEYGEYPLGNELELEDSESAELELTEGGFGEEIGIALSAAPSEEVTVTLDSNNGYLNFSEDTLYFDADNWEEYQYTEISVTDNTTYTPGGYSDTAIYEMASLDENWDGVEGDLSEITITEDDSPGVTITQSGGTTAVTEGAGNDTYTVVLDSTPTDTVTITVSPEAGLGASPTTLTFTTGNATNAQTVTVTGTDDDEYTGNRNLTITHSASSSDGNYNGIGIASVTVAVTEDESLDNEGPTGSAEITVNGETTITTNDDTVELTLAATDNIDDTADLEMRLSTSAIFSGASWVNFATTYEWTISTENGDETVYIQFRDQNTNVSEVYSITITADNAAPMADSIAINSPDETASGESQTYVNDRKIKIHLDVNDIGTQAQMMISEDKDFDDAEWEDFKDNFSLKLDDKEGKRHIYIKFKDAAGNISEVLKKKVVLDREKPEFEELNISTESINYKPSQEIYGKTEKKSKIKIYLDGVTYSETKADEDGYFNFGLLYIPHGTKEIRIQIKDRAKNKENITININYPTPVYYEPIREVKVIKEVKDTVTEKTPTIEKVEKIDKTEQAYEPVAEQPQPKKTFFQRIFGL